MRFVIVLSKNSNLIYNLLMYCTLIRHNLEMVEIRLVFKGFIYSMTIVLTGCRSCQSSVDRGSGERVGEEE